ncbi:unnamed protein product [Sympodiomycopsis kandeliae]
MDIPHNPQPGNISFTINPHGDDPTAVRLTGLSDHQDPSQLLRDVFWDPFFSKKIDVERSSSAAQGSSSHSQSTTRISDDACFLLEAHGFHIASSGLATDSLAYGGPSHAAAAQTVADASPRGRGSLELMGQLSQILGEFLAENAEKATIQLAHPSRLPGPQAAPRLVTNFTDEPTVNSLFAQEECHLINALLDLSHQAVQWKHHRLSQQGQGEEESAFPLPLDQPLRLIPCTGTQPTNGDADGIEAARLSKPDLGVFHGNQHVAVIVKKPRRDPTHIKTLTNLHTQPLTNVLRAARQRQHTSTRFASQRGAGVGSSAAARRPAPQHSNSAPPRCSYDEHLLAQLSSQLLLRSVSSGLLLTDWDRSLLSYQLVPSLDSQPTSAAEASAENDGHDTNGNTDTQRSFRLLFAPEAIYSHVPPLGFEEGSQNDPRTIADSATRNAANAPHSNAPSVSFACQPGVTWGIIAWILSAFQVHKLQTASSGDGREPGAGQHVVVASHSYQEEARDHSSTGTSGGSVGLMQQGLTGMTSEPLQLWVLSAPWAFGAHANMYRCIHQDHAPTVKTLESSLGKSALISTKHFSNDRVFLVKVHRRALSIISDPKLLQGQAPGNLLSGDEFPENRSEVDSIQAAASREATAFKILSAFQGTILPILYGTLPTYSFPFSHADKLVVEKVGDPLSILLQADSRETLSLWWTHISEGIRRAVAQCHTRGVAHGDLSPSNILVQWWHREGTDYKRKVTVPIPEVISPHGGSRDSQRKATSEESLRNDDRINHKTNLTDRSSTGAKASAYWQSQIPVLAPEAHQFHQVNGRDDIEGLKPDCDNDSNYLDDSNAVAKHAVTNCRVLSPIMSRGASAWSQRQCEELPPGSSAASSSSMSVTSSSSFTTSLSRTDGSASPTPQISLTVRVCLIDWADAAFSSEATEEQTTEEGSAEIFEAIRQKDLRDVEELVHRVESLLQ